MSKAHATERFLPDVERTRRAIGRFLFVAGLAGGALLAWLDFQSGRVTGTALVLFALLAALVAWSSRLAFRPDQTLDVDVASRTYVLTNRGKQPQSGPLDDLGPLVIGTRLSGMSGSNRPRQVIYVVHAAIHKKVELFAVPTPGRARQRMEELGRRWRLPCRGLGGAVRAADELDMPLHVRLRDDRDAREPTPLRPEWKVRVERVPGGYAMVSDNRSWGAFGGSLVLGAVGLFLVFGRRDMLSSIASMLRDAQGQDPLPRVLVALMGVVLLVLLRLFWGMARDALFPGTVRIGSEGVSYRWSRMALRDLEEIAVGGSIELVSDRRILELASSFCPAGAHDAVARELQRLILEVAPARSQA